jgi:hypothetical protein
MLHRQAGICSIRNEIHLVCNYESKYDSLTAYIIQVSGIFAPCILPIEGIISTLCPSQGTPRKGFKIILYTAIIIGQLGIPGPLLS